MAIAILFLSYEGSPRGISDGKAEMGQFLFIIWFPCQYHFTRFNVHGSVHRNNIRVHKSQRNAYVTEFILSDNCCICFGRHYRPSSGAQKTVNTTSGKCYTVLLSAAIVEVLELMQSIDCIY
jgi:hypothetical protein